MSPKTIVFLMFVVLTALYILSKFFIQKERKQAQFERYFFEKLFSNEGKLEGIKEDVTSYGKSLGLSEEKIHSLIKENTIA